MGSMAFKIERAPGFEKSLLAKKTCLEHHKERRQFMNDMQVLFTSPVLCFACLRQSFQRRSPRRARDPHSGSLLPDMLLEDICVLFASFKLWSPHWCYDFEQQQRSERASRNHSRNRTAVCEYISSIEMPVA